MTPEDITEIIMRRLDKRMDEIKIRELFSEEWRQSACALTELTDLLAEIRALKENETKD